ncbi:SKP1-like protein 3 [Bienertia sinuspersici]
MSSDDERFDVEETIALEPQTIKHMNEDDFSMLKKQLLWNLKHSSLSLKMIILIAQFLFLMLLDKLLLKY